MSKGSRKLVKHDLQAQVPYGQPAPPPMAEPPGMAETLRLLEKISRMPDIRFDRVQEMRGLIAQGQLETPERIDGTVKRLMEELGL